MQDLEAGRQDHGDDRDEPILSAYEEGGPDYAIQRTRSVEITDGEVVSLVRVRHGVGGVEHDPMPCYNLFTVVRGRPHGRIDLGRGPFERDVEPGDMALAPPGAALSFYGDATRDVAIVSIPPQTVDRILAYANMPPSLLFSRLQKRIFQDSLISSLILSFWSGIDAAPEADRAYVTNAVGAILVRLAMRADPDFQTPEPRQQDAVRHRFAELADYVNANLSGALTLEELSAVMGCSPYHLARMFRQETGRTVHEFVLARRLSRARDLLSQTDTSIADIAMLTGFSSQSHLTSVFKRQYSDTPGEYRRRIRI